MLAKAEFIGSKRQKNTNILKYYYNLKELFFQHRYSSLQWSFWNHSRFAAQETWLLSMWKLCCFIYFCENVNRSQQDSIEI